MNQNNEFQQYLDSLNFSYKIKYSKEDSKDKVINSIIDTIAHILKLGFTIFTIWFQPDSDDARYHVHSECYLSSITCLSNNKKSYHITANVGLTYIDPAIDNIIEDYVSPITFIINNDDTINKNEPKISLFMDHFYRFMNVVIESYYRSYGNDKEFVNPYIEIFAAEGPENLSVSDLTVEEYVLERSYLLSKIISATYANSSGNVIITQPDPIILYSKTFSVNEYISGKYNSIFDGIFKAWMANKYEAITLQLYYNMNILEVSNEDIIEKDILPPDLFGIGFWLNKVRSPNKVNIYSLEVENAAIPGCPILFNDILKMRSILKEHVDILITTIRNHLESKYNEELDPDQLFYRIMAIPASEQVDCNVSVEDFNAIYRKEIKDYGKFS